MDDFVERGIRERGVIEFVMSVSPVTDEVHEDIFAIPTLVGQGEAGGLD